MTPEPHLGTLVPAPSVGETIGIFTIPEDEGDCEDIARERPRAMFMGVDFCQNVEGRYRQRRLSAEPRLAEKWLMERGSSEVKTGR